jgi:hypothetical protein
VGHGKYRKRMSVSAERLGIARDLEKLKALDARSASMYMDKRKSKWKAFLTRLKKTKRTIERREDQPHRVNSRELGAP